MNSLLFWILGQCSKKEYDLTKIARQVIVGIAIISPNFSLVFEKIEINSRSHIFFHIIYI